MARVKSPQASDFLSYFVPEPRFRLAPVSLIGSYSEERSLSPTLYSEATHRHRFAAWCAATAAKSSPNCRFTVEQGVKFIEGCGLRALSEDWTKIPEPEEFDYRHRIWRERMVNCAPNVLQAGERRNFTAGVAAKLINCYLKPLYITGMTLELTPAQTAMRDAIHPPIDRILLLTLAAENVGSMRSDWKRFASIGWSNFTHDQYQTVIDMVRHVTKGRLWIIEEHWGGYQSRR